MQTENRTQILGCDSASWPLWLYLQQQISVGGSPWTRALLAALWVRRRQSRRCSSLVSMGHVPRTGHIFGSCGSGRPLEKLSLLLSCLKLKTVGLAQMWYRTGLWQVWGGQFFSGGNGPSLLWSRPTDVHSIGGHFWSFIVSIKLELRKKNWGLNFEGRRVEVVEVRKSDRKRSVHCRLVYSKVVKNKKVFFCNTC